MRSYEIETFAQTQSYAFNSVSEIEAAALSILKSGSYNFEPNKLALEKFALFLDAFVNGNIDFEYDACGVDIIEIVQILTGYLVTYNLGDIEQLKLRLDELINDLGE